MHALSLFRQQFFECQILAEGQHLASLADLMYEGTEDGWFETCMYVLGVRKVVEPNLMGDVRRKNYQGRQEEGCDSDAWFAGYYPVKDKTEFARCARVIAAVDRASSKAARGAAGDFESVASRADAIAALDRASGKREREREKKERREKFENQKRGHLKYHRVPGKVPTRKHQ